jgi:membrane associated rhomboid family serine protease
MIPVRDTVPSRNYPIVTHSIIGINVVFFLMQMMHVMNVDRFVYYYGLVPARYSSSHYSQYFTSFEQVAAFFSYMFIHGGFLHLLGNMWSLYIFGDNVEDYFGHFRYFVFYILCGLASGISHLVLNVNSNIPTIGASGAIAGVMGAYLLLHPRAKILTLIPIIIIPYFVEIPAYFFLGFWFIMQFFNATVSQGNAGGVAWWAHIGGFMFGIMLLKFLPTLPSTGVSDRLREVTVKKKTPKLQVIHPAARGNEPDLYGSLTVTTLEAFGGTEKLVNIPWGFQKRLYKVIIPARTKSGNLLRLSGLGKIMPDGRRGDLFLKVTVAALNKPMQGTF